VLLPWGRPSRTSHSSAAGLSSARTAAGNTSHSSFGYAYTDNARHGVQDPSKSVLLQCQTWKGVSRR
jgi:hypothetical protein